MRRIFLFLLSLVLIPVGTDGCFDAKYSELRQNASLLVIRCQQEAFDDVCIRQSGTQFARCMWDSQKRDLICCAPSSVVISLLTARGDGIVRADMMGFESQQRTALGARVILSQGGRLFDDPIDGNRVAQSQGNEDAPNTHVSPLVFGETYTSRGVGVFKGTASVALIRDNYCNVVVNTAAPGHEQGIRKGLSIARLSADDIHHVVVTSNYVQLTGNVHLFARASIYAEHHVFYALETAQNRLARESTLHLCENVAVIRTGGPTPRSTSVIVRNVEHLGVLAIVGVLFANDTLPFTWDSNQKRRSQQRIICMADYVMPSFGDVWRVTEQMKSDRRC